MISMEHLNLRELITYFYPLVFNLSFIIILKLKICYLRGILFVDILMIYVSIIAVHYQQ